MPIRTHYKNDVLLNELSKRYILALSAVALLSILGQILIQIELADQKSDSRVIFLAGRQSTLAQRLCKNALVWEYSQDTVRRKMLFQALKDDAILWERGHDNLFKGNPEIGLVAHKDIVLEQEFEEFEPLYQAERTALHALLDAIKNAPHVSHMNYVTDLLATDGAHYQHMGNILIQYLDDAQERISWLRTGEIALAITTLLVLLLEGLLIFKPIVVRIRRAIDDLFRTAETLSQSEERFSRAFHSSPTAISITSLSTGKFIDINDNFCKMTGYAYDELIDRTSTQLNMHISDGFRLQVIRVLNEQGTIHALESSIHTKRGEERHLLSSIEKITLNNEPCMLVTSLDITERKRAEEERQKSERELADFFENATVGLHWVGPDGIIQRVNKAELEMLGYTSEEYVGRHIADFHVDRNIIEDILQRLRNNEIVHNYEAQLRCKNGSVKDVLIDSSVLWEHGEFIHTRCFTRDVTEQKRAQEELRMSQELFATAFQASPATISILGFHDRKFIDVNESYCQSIGFSREEIIGKTPRELGIVVEDATTKELAQHLIQGGALRSCEVRVRTKSGEIRTVLASAETVYIGGKPSLLGMAIDMTETKRHQEALRQAEERFSKAFHAAPVAIGITSLEDNTYIDVNETYSDIVGWSREDILGKTADDLGIFLAGANQESFSEFLREAGLIYNVETIISSRTGELFHILGSNVFIELDGKSCVLSIFVDITERKRAEESRRQYEERFFKIFNNSPIPISLTSVKEGRMIDANESFCNALGYTQVELLGKTSLELGIMSQSDRNEVVSTVYKEGAIHHNMEVILRTRTGELRNYLTSLEALTINGEECLLSMLVDITERKQAEEKLAERERWHRELLEALPIAIYTTDAAGHITYYNQAAVEFSGRRPEIDSDQWCITSQLYWPDGTPLLHDECPMAIALKENRPVLGVEAIAAKPDGTLVPFVPFPTPLRDTSGNLIGAVNALVDITAIRAAEEARRQSEEHFSKIFHAAPIAMSFTSLNRRVLLDVNESYCRLVGLSREQLIGQPISQIPMLMNVSREELIHRLMEEGTIHNTDTIFSRSDGSLRYCLTSMERIDTNDESCVLGMTLDITDQKKIQEELQESEKRFRSLFEQAIVGMKRANLKGQWLEFNQEFCDMFGYTREELQTMTFRDITTPEEIQKDEALMKQMQENMIPGYTREKEYIHKNGQSVWAQISVSLVRNDEGVPLSFSAIVQDITDLKKAREEVARQEQYFRALIENSTDIILTLDRSGHIQYASPSITKLLGHRVQELHSKPLLDMIYAEDQPLMEQTLEELIKYPHKTFRIKNFRICQSNGAVRYFEASITNLLSNTAIEGIIINARDITERKLAEEELRAAGLRFRATFEQAAVGMTHVDLSGRLIRVNQRLCNILGYTREELTLLTFQEITHPDDLESNMEQVQALLAGEIQSFSVEKRYIRKNGSLVWADLSVAAVRDNDTAKYFIATIQDITERKKNDEELQRSQERFFSAFHTSPIPTCISTIAEGKLIDINQSYLRLIGSRREEALNSSKADMDIFADKRIRNEILHVLSEEGSINNFETSINTHSGGERNILLSIVPIDLNGTPCLLSMALDITERKQSDEALRESESRFRIMADSTPVMVWLSDVDKLCYFFNKGWLEFTGRTMQEEEGNGWTEGVHAHDLQQCLDTYIACFDARKEFKIEYRLRRYDGQYRWVLDHGVPRFLPDGTFAGYIGSCVDITEIKQAETSLTAARNSAEEANNFKTKLLSGLGYEFSTPVNSIISFASLLEKEKNFDNHALYVNKIYSNAQRLLKTLNDVVILAQAEPNSKNLALSALSLEREARSSVEMYEAIAREQEISLIFEGINEPLMIQADQQMIRQILDNLISNAIKFTHHGSVQIRLRRENQHNTAFAVIEVEDSGIGISTEYLPYVFEEFSQEVQSVAGTYSGMGLGLSIVKRYVEILNASVRVQSKKGEGTIFSVRFPIVSSVPSLPEHSQ